MDAAFRASGRVGISGASTVSALSSAVVERLTHQWRAIRNIDICIAPAQTAPRGEATLAAVLSYCGGPIQAPGARACMGLLGLDEFHPEFERWGMVTDVPAEEVLDGASAF